MKRKILSRVCAVIVMMFVSFSLIASNDYSATIASVNNVFNGLANGTGGFPQLQDDDFLFCWTFEQITLPDLNCKVKVFDANTTTKKTILAFLESM